MSGVNLDKVFVERGVSGSIPVADRPEGRELWSSLKAGDTLIAAKLDRLFRSALDALQTVELLQKRRVSVVLLDLGGDISGNGLSKFFLTIAAAFAEAERDRIKERIIQVKSDQRQQGRYLGGKVPFGYRVGDNGDLVPHPDEQAMIADVERLAREGATVRSAQSHLVTAHGKRLSLDAIHRLVRSAKRHPERSPADGPQRP